MPLGKQVQWLEFPSRHENRSFWMYFLSIAKLEFCPCCCTSPAIAVFELLWNWVSIWFHSQKEIQKSLKLLHSLPTLGAPGSSGNFTAFLKLLQIFVRGDFPKKSRPMGSKTSVLRPKRQVASPDPPKKFHSTSWLPCIRLRETRWPTGEKQEGMSTTVVGGWVSTQPLLKHDAQVKMGEIFPN